jgi:hypothetical protein
MKTVFRGTMEISFGDNVADFMTRFPNKEFPFASADGISGVVKLNDAKIETSTRISADIVIETERKRMFPDFEAYLELIKTVLGGSSKISVVGLRDIRKVDARYFSDLSFVKTVNDLAILEDVDGEFTVVRPETKVVLNSFQTLEEAEQFAQNWGSNS